MTCLEAQTKIIAYIDGNLDKETRIDFLRHIKTCDDCKEELDIYYTMIEGMHQMDSNLPLSKDFSTELQMQIDRELKQSKKKKELLRYSVIIVLIGVLGFGIIGYINFLNILYSNEQNKIKEAQGDYYYSDNFDDVLFEPETRLLNINIDTDTTEEPSFYSRIRQYNAVSNLK